MRLSKTLAFVKLLLILPSDITASVAASTWTGNTNTDWRNPTNWDGSPPGPATSNLDLKISTSPSGGRYPILGSGTYSIRRLEIEADATLTQNGDKSQIGML